MPFYAVRRGHEPGIYFTWQECEKQVKGFSKAVYKKFETKFDAIEFIITKSPSKTLSTENECLAKEPPKTSNLDLSKENTSTDQTSSTHKRKLDLNDKYQQSNENNLPNTTTTSTNESKEDKTKTNEETPVDKKPRSNLDKSQSSKSETKQSIGSSVRSLSSSSSSSSNQESYLTQYENKKQDFSFYGHKASVYTDGACSNNGKPNAMAGIGVFWGKNHPLNISKRLEGLQTNNRAEITAAIVAISQALTYNASELTIYTDSKFMMNAINDWINKWKINGWKTSNGESVKNVDDFKRLDYLCSKMKVKWEYVPGHKGYFGNEQADKLATQCLK